MILVALGHVQDRQAIYVDMCPVMKFRYIMFFRIEDERIADAVVDTYGLEHGEVVWDTVMVTDRKHDTWPHGYFHPCKTNRMIQEMPPHIEDAQNIATRRCLDMDEALECVGRDDEIVIEEIPPPPALRGFLPTLPTLSVTKREGLCLADVRSEFLDSFPEYEKHVVNELVTLSSAHTDILVRDCAFMRAHQYRTLWIREERLGTADYPEGRWMFGLGSEHYLTVMYTRDSDFTVDILISTAQDYPVHNVLKIPSVMTETCEYANGMIVRFRIEPRTYMHIPTVALLRTMLWIGQKFRGKTVRDTRTLEPKAFIT
jgi:hypothetical protein